MHALKAAVPLALAVGLIAGSPAAAAPHGSTGSAGDAPVAHLLGDGGGPPVYPGLVNSRLVRAQRALDRAVDYADEDQDGKAVAALYKVRLQMRLAWRAAKHVIDTAPPPAPAGDGAARASRARRLTGAAPGAGAVADQYMTAGGVLALEHTVAQTAIGTIDTSHGALRDALSRTIFAALDKRDAAVAYIHSIDVPAPPGDGVAHLMGAPVGGTWGTVMPPVGGQIEDEINQIEGALGLSQTMGAGIRRVLKDAEFQDILTQRAIDQFWPPVVGD
jgi:hypothetical protein